MVEAEAGEVTGETGVESEIIPFLLILAKE